MVEKSERFPILGMTRDSSDEQELLFEDPTAVNNEEDFDFESSMSKSKSSIMLSSMEMIPAVAAAASAPLVAPISVECSPIEEKKSAASSPVVRMSKDDESLAASTVASPVRCIQDFDIQKQIGKAADGSVLVYLATDRISGEDCVVKKSLKCKLRVFEDPAKEIQLMREMKALGGHSGICKFIDSFEDDEYIWNVMEFCHKGDLLERVLSEGRISEDKCKVYFKQLVSAVKWMHFNGFYHLDISPENILFTSEDSVKLCDFGMTRTSTKGCSKFPRIKENRVLGKVGYCAPEIYQMFDFDAALCDVYSMGVVLFVMLFKVPPYSIPMESRDSLFKCIINGRIEYLLKVWKFKDLPSAEAFDFLKRTICHADKRMTLDEMEAHPWLSGESN